MDTLLADLVEWFKKHPSDGLLTAVSPPKPGSPLDLSDLEIAA